MPQSIKVTDFSSGWCPSDDAHEGRLSALLQMDNVELDENGALSLIGSEIDQTTTSAQVYEIYSNNISNNRYDFVAMTNGEVDQYVGSSRTQILTNGDPTNTAFSTAFDYTLICSGIGKVKTNGSSVIGLGVGAPDQAPIANAGSSDITDIFYTPDYNVQDWSNVHPSESFDVITDWAKFDQSESWAGIGNAGLSFTNDGPGDFQSSIVLSYGSAPGTGANSYEADYTPASPLSLLTGSDNPSEDAFIWWIKVSANVVTSMQINLTDINNNVAGYGYSFGSNVIPTNSWTQFSIGLRGDGSTTDTTSGKQFQYPSNFDWDHITLIKIYGTTNLSNKACSFQFSGFQFTGTQTEQAVQPTVGNGTGYPQWEITANKAVFETSILSTAISFNTFSSGATATNNDQFTFQIRGGVTGSGTQFGDNSCINTVQVYILLTNPGANFTAGSDYFTYLWKNPGATGSNNITISISRQDFTREGVAQIGWESIYAIMWIVTVNNPVYIAIADSQVPWVTFANHPAYTFFGGSDALNGTYQYEQVNVNNTGAYIAKSPPSPISLPVVTHYEKVSVDFEAPQDPQVNEVWIYRRGGTLDQFYRVAVIPQSAFHTNFVDNVSDTTALATDITLNLNLDSIQNLGKIFDIVGPIEGRWFYFTSNTMWPSDINDPDVYDRSLGVTTTGSSSEIFLWARKVSDAAVCVGTSRDVYLLTGTFVSLPDGTVDIYYRPLVCAFPPITYDANAYNGTIFYFAKDGWRSIDGNGTNQNLTDPNTNLLYRGDTRYNYSPINLAQIINSKRMPVIVARNKVWCSIEGQQRLEVFDLLRKTWHVEKYGSDITALCSCQDGTILAGLGAKLSSLSNRSGRINQSVNILTCQFDNSVPRQRKDAYTLRVRFGIGSNGTLNYTINTDTNNATGSISVNATSGIPQDVMIDLSQQISKARWFQFYFNGIMNELILQEFEIYYDQRPTELTFIRGYNDNFNTGARKHIRTWPFVIDTEGTNATLIPYSDNVAQPPLVINTNDKTTVLYYFTSEISGIDYGYTIQASAGNIFEFWGTLAPDILEQFPVKKRFLIGYNNNFNVASKKRVRTWPFVINTFGYPVNITASVDDVPQPTSTYITNDKDTILYFFDTDVFGIDYSYTIQGNNPFEFWGTLDPEIVEILPVAKQFDQVGPFDFQRYGRVQKIEFRILAYGTTIPYKIYMNEAVVLNTNLATVNGTDMAYYVNVPKGTSGNVIRMELGPVGFNFHRIAVRILCSITGRDTENQWINL